MESLNRILRLEVSRDRLNAKLSLREVDEALLKESKLTKEKVLQFIKNHQIDYGIDYEAVESLVQRFPNLHSPITIAQGVSSEDGEAGRIDYFFDLTTEVERNSDDEFDFRDVMRIPTVKAKEKLATIIPPSKGKDGVDVYRNPIKARPGKPALLRAGKNVSYDESTMSFFAEVDGQVSIHNRRIDVLDVYEVNESISMKIGNIDFPGTVVIRGDVPTGFTIKASGDIHIYGLVEAARIQAGGSVTITEGIAGLKTGKIEAGKSVHIGYINQGIIRAQENILVENSIMHSECTANQDIICNRGNIVGGIISAGGAIKANHVGNRMNTKTSLSFGMDYKLFEKQRDLEAKLAKLQENVKKLNTVKASYQAKKDLPQDRNARITMLRLSYSLEKTNEQIMDIKEELAAINASLGDVDRAYLKVTGKLYPNVTVSFGKYERTIDKEYVNVTIVTDKNEIVIRS